jgi:hypothetical protein
VDPACIAWVGIIGLPATKAVAWACCVPVVWTLLFVPLAVVLCANVLDTRVCTCDEAKFIFPYRVININVNSCHFKQGQRKAWRIPSPKNFTVTLTFDLENQ